MKANLKPKTRNMNDSGALDVAIVGAVGVLIVGLLVVAILPTFANSTADLDANVNIADASISILNTTELFMALIVLAVAAAVVIALFRF